MAKSRNQKGKILVLEHLLQGTGESRIVTMQEILDKTSGISELHCREKSIYDDIEALREIWTGCSVQKRQTRWILSGRGTGNCCGTGGSSHKRGSRDFKKMQRQKKKSEPVIIYKREYT